jgi:hypothetical protein
MRQCDIPRELLIGDGIWTVKFVRKVPQVEKGYLLGLCDPCDRIIYIRQGQSYIDRADTFLHELIHALDFEYDLNIKHKTVYGLARGMALTMVANF